MEAIGEHNFWPKTKKGKNIDPYFDLEMCVLCGVSLSPDAPGVVETVADPLLF